MPQFYKALLQFFHELTSTDEMNLGQDLVSFNNKEILTDHKLSFRRSALGKGLSESTTSLKDWYQSFGQ